MGRRLRRLGKRLVKPLMIGLLVMILLLLIPAAFGPTSGPRRILFAVVLYASIALLLTAIFVGWAQLERLREEVNELRLYVARHVGVCQARRADHEIEARFETIMNQFQRSA